MTEIKIFVDVKDDTNSKAVISPINAEKLGITSGSSVEVYNPDNGTSAIAEVEVSDIALDFAGQISKNIVDQLEFVGIELVLRPSAEEIPVVKAQQPSPEQEITAPAPATTAPKSRLEPPKPHLPGISL